MKNERQSLILKRGKEASLMRRHPWVFSGAIKETGNEQIPDGTMVDIYSHNGEFLGMGHYQSGTSIAVRILSFTPSDEKSLFRKRIQSAWEYRKRIGIAENPNTNVFRLIFAEGDGLSGLVVDYYNGAAVLQAHSMGMYLSRSLIAETISEVLGKRLKAVYDKSKETLHVRHGDVENRYILGSAEESGVVMENGRQFIVNWVTGQKTGFFIDQRENRTMVGKYSSGKRVLNTFCYTGGFSVYAGSCNAREVHSVDSSKAALTIAEENMQLNKITNYENFTADVFDYLQSCGEYDMIILDPPAFAKRLNARHQAVIGYKRLNSAAIKKITPGGILFTFSCSQTVARRLFQDTVIASAIEAGRNIRIMHWLSQPKDHPVDIYHPEGEYLKGLAAYVE
ncbi:MAG: class I SAM-dependent rRNA methyltransferase [Deltaproteobacteria bacterium]|nr:class I SAM-dependent rRNA methyltransferase [Deltaproteobacteria bacterium]